MAGPGQAALVIPGADGSDGVFNPTSNVTIDLGQATTAAWDAPSPVAGKGVYDGAKWAVVFKYSEVNIPAGVSVGFKNHPNNPPVVWLVSGNVTIAGAVNLNGSSQSGAGALQGAGPGGFRGGASDAPGILPSTGFGPGGPLTLGYTLGGAYGPPVGQVYGNAAIIPLIGGSGGSARGAYQQGSGGGGGAILIACANSIEVSGGVTANGGPSDQGGSGGAVRLVADSYAVTGSIRCATGGNGGDGRIRIEVAHGVVTGSIGPQPSYGAPANPVKLWPAEDAPSVTVTQVTGLTVPADPVSGLDFPNQDVSLTAEGTPVTIRVQATNVPLDWNVKVRMGPRNGQASWISATMLPGGTLASSEWEATVTSLPKGFTAFQARASKP